MNKITLHTVANDIVEDLFVNGAGQKAKRLVLKLENDMDGGGWGKGPVRDIIKKHIKKTLDKFMGE